MAWSSTSFLWKLTSKSVHPNIRKLFNISTPSEVKSLATDELNSVAIPKCQKSLTLYQPEQGKCTLEVKHNNMSSPQIKLEASTKSVEKKLLKGVQMKKIIEDWIPSPLYIQKGLVDWKMRSIEETPFDVVDTEEKLEEMMCDLRKLEITEIAFDVKNSFSSYKRLTCLISISTRFKDYLVDCLKLKHRVKQLREIFQNPYVLKVTFCDRAVDVTCLEKDFDISVVGLFDTWKAEKVILAHHGQGTEWNGELKTFTYLLFKYLNIESSHHGHWRMRPLSDTTINAARRDSHYLLNVYDKQKEVLVKLNHGHMVDVYEFSKIIQLQNSLVRNGNEWMYKYKEHLSNKKWNALTELNTWRKEIAQKSNSNVHSIAKNKTLAQLVDSSPKDEEEILAIISTGSSPAAIEHFRRDSALLLKIFHKSDSD